MKNDSEWELFLNKVTAENELFDRPWFQRVFSYYLRNKPLYISHGGCCIINGCGVLIMGECGQGKSTLINILNNKGIVSLSDDRIMLEGVGNDMICFSTPWNLKNPCLINNIAVPVKLILFLEHSTNDENSLTALANEEAKKKIISQFYLPFPYHFAKAYRDANQFTSIYKRPVYTFSFTPDDTAFDYLMENLK